MMSYQSPVFAGVAAAALLFAVVSERKAVASNKKAIDAEQTAMSLQKQVFEMQRRQPEGRETASSSQDDAPAVTTPHSQEGEGLLRRDALVVQPIGRVRSIFRLCVGTPRQGLLAPAARGRIELFQMGDASASAAVDGLQEFQYIWIHFVFHLNNNNNNHKQQPQPQQQQNGGTTDKRQRFKSKIAPPALGGRKVGVLATRSPHRFNPIGMTLCKLDRIQTRPTSTTKGGMGGSQKPQPGSVILHVSGLDLVDGTPVLDIKPYVPFYDSVDTSSSSSSATSMLPPPTVPNWVEGGLATYRTVVVTPQAQRELQAILNDDPKALDFYRGDDAASQMLDCIRQVLSMDVRSKHQTRKARKGQFQAERSQRIVEHQESISKVEEKPLLSSSSSSSSSTSNTASEENSLCTQQLDNLLVYYRTQEATDASWDAAENSGAQDIVTVERIEMLVSTPTKDGTNC